MMVAEQANHKSFRPPGAKKDVIKEEQAGRRHSQLGLVNLVATKAEREGH